MLLDFWGTWCGPCVAAVPKLVETYEKYHPRGFEIIGLDCKDTEEELRKFIAGKKLTWVQTREENEASSIHRLYRVLAWPKYLLLGQDGKIIVAGMGQVDFYTELEKLLPEK